ncbi:hypothetical protein BGZ65_011173, partial [Modicella reniformis]
MSYNTADQKLICTILAAPLFDVSETESPGCFSTRAKRDRSLAILRGAFDLEALLESMKTDIAVDRLRIEALLAVADARKFLGLHEHPELPWSKRAELVAKTDEYADGIRQIEERRSRLWSAYEAVAARVGVMNERVSGPSSPAVKAHERRVEAARAQLQRESEDVEQDASSQEEPLSDESSSQEEPSISVAAVAPQLQLGLGEVTQSAGSSSQKLPPMDKDERSDEQCKANNNKS